MQTGRVKTQVLACCILLSSQAVKAELSDFLELPSDWELSPIQGQSCGMGAQGGNGGAENSYSETSSKFLTWLTGDVELAEYEPIGEVANYFGFAALRTEIRERLGSQGDTRFRGSIYREILELLDDDQRGVLYDLMNDHRPLLRGFLDERVELVNELWSQKEGKAIDFGLVEELMLSIGKYEGALMVTAARAYSEVTEMLTEEQLEYLWDVRKGEITADDMRSSSLTYASKANAQFDSLNEFDQEIMQEISSKVIAWVTGDLDDAIYLPPGKIGNYFGFANYRYVDRAQVSRGGAAQLVHDNLTEEQRSLMCDLSWNVVNFTNAYIDGRAELISEAFKLQTDPTAPTDMVSMVERYAEIGGVGEGRRATLEAMTFNLIESMLSDEQIATFDSLRTASTSGGARSGQGGGGNGGGGNGGGGNGGGMGGGNR